MLPIILGAILVGAGSYFGAKLAKKVDLAVTVRAVDMPLDDTLTSDQQAQLRFMMLNAQRPAEIDSALIVLGSMNQATGNQFPLAKAALNKRRDELTV